MNQSNSGFNKNELRACDLGTRELVEFISKLGLSPIEERAVYAAAPMMYERLCEMCRDLVPLIGTKSSYTVLRSTLATMLCISESFDKHDPIEGVTR